MTAPSASPFLCKVAGWEEALGRAFSKRAFGEKFVPLVTASLFRNRSGSGVKIRGASQPLRGGFADANPG